MMFEYERFQQPTKPVKNDRNEKMKDTMKSATHERAMSETENVDCLNVVI